MKVKNGVVKSLTSFVIISILVIGVSAYFVFDEKLIGPAFLALGLITMIFLKLFNIKVASVYPDIIFGFVDNGVLVFAAVLGGMYAGITGAIIGGAAGNTLTDGIGGLLEGHVAEKLRKKKIVEERTALSTMLGKIIGCLFGAGVGLILVWLISFI
jgi:hypothetical protein